MTSKMEEIRGELAGKTGMNPELEADLIARIAEVEENGGLVKPMSGADLILGLALAIFLGIAPVILTGAGIL